MKAFILIIALAISFPLQEDLFDLAEAIASVNPTIHDIAHAILGFANAALYSDKDFKAEKCVVGLNDIVDEVEKIIATWNPTIDYLIKIITELALKFSPIFNNCKEGWTEIEAVGARMFTIFEDFQVYGSKILTNLFSMIGMIGIEVQAARTALLEGDYNRFGGDLGEIFYQIVLKNC